MQEGPYPSKVPGYSGAAVPAGKAVLERMCRSASGRAADWRAAPCAHHLP